MFAIKTFTLLEYYVHVANTVKKHINCEGPTSKEWTININVISKKFHRSSHICANNYLKESSLLN